VASLAKALDLPNESDSFRTMIEQVIEDTLVVASVQRRLKSVM